MLNIKILLKIIALLVKNGFVQNVKKFIMMNTFQNIFYLILITLMFFVLNIKIFISIIFVLIIIKKFVINALMKEINI